jgi:hypothetical protein
MIASTLSLQLSKIKSDHNISEAGMNEIYKLVNKGMPIDMQYRSQEPLYCTEISRRASSGLCLY